MYADDENLRLKPSVSIVRDFLDATNCVSMNPFLAARTTEQLLEAMQDFSKDIKDAALKLSSLVQIDAPRFEDDAGAGYLAEGLLKRIHVEKVAPEILLNNAFTAAIKEPYFTLRAMETAELEAAMNKTKPAICPVMAQKVMDGLEGLHVFTCAVPKVYQSLANNELAPNRAVA